MSIKVALFLFVIYAAILFVAWITTSFFTHRFYAALERRKQQKALRPKASEDCLTETELRDYP